MLRVFFRVFFPKRLTSRGFRNQKEGGAGFWPISPGSVSEAGAGSAIGTYRSDAIQRCTSVKYTFGWSILGCTPRRGALRDTQRNLAPPAEGLSEIHKEIWDLFFLGLTTLLGFSGAVVLLYSSKVLNSICKFRSDYSTRFFF